MSRARAKEARAPTQQKMTHNMMTRSKTRAAARANPQCAQARVQKRPTLAKIGAKLDDSIDNLVRGMDIPSYLLAFLV